jgi:hypothetical protein
MNCLNFRAAAVACALALVGALTGTLEAQSTRPALSISRAAGNRVELSWPSAAGSFVIEQSAALGTALWQPVTEAQASRADAFVVSLPATDSARFYRLRSGSVVKTFQVIETAPSDGATEVGVTFRPKVSFSEPVNPASLTTNSFYASAAGRLLNAAIVPANDGTFAWLFLQQPMPGGTEVRVTLDGSRIFSAKDGVMLDPDGDGAAGGVADFAFTTVSVQALAGTSLSGIVTDPGPDTIPRTADDLSAGVDGQVGTSDDRFLLPIAGVKVFLLGREDQPVITGADGLFHFDAVPAGDVKVVVDGRTASNPPAGMYFPEMVIDAQMIPGQANWTMTNGPEVYLPRLASAILQTVDVTKINVIQATPEGAQGLSAFQRSQLTIELPANSLIGPDGRPLSSGQIGISTVPSDIVRDMLPPGVLQHTFDITVQAPGIATFSTPAAMTFPNVFNAAPGTKLNFLSFDHTTGRLVIEGTATVTADGASVRTDPGTGITHPGWHGLTPPGSPNDPPDPPDPECQDELIAADEHENDIDSSPLPFGSRQGAIRALSFPDAAPAQTEGIKDYFFTDDSGEFTLTFRHTGPAPQSKSKTMCGPTGPKALVIRISLFGNEKTKSKPNRFLEGLEKFTMRPFLLRPGQEKKMKVTTTKLLKDIKSVEKDRLYGARLVIVAWEQGNPRDLLINRAMSVGRWLDAADADHTDGVLSISDTATGRDGNPGVSRKRSFETRGAILSLRRKEASPSPLSVQANDIVFAPTGRGPRTSEILEVVNEFDRVIGTVTAEGNAKLQEFFVDGDKIKAVLAKAAAGQVTNVTDAQKAFLNQPGALDRIVAGMLGAIDNLLADYGQGIARLSSDPTVGVHITAYSSTDAAHPNTVGALTLGRSDAVDICSGDGLICLQPNIPADPHPLFELLKLVPKVSQSEIAFRLSQALNQRPQGSFEMYIDHFLTAKRPNTGEPFILSEEKLIGELTTTVVHEIGHTLGLIHTFNAGVQRITKGCGCALAPNGTPLPDYRSDIMSQGEVLSPPVFSVSGAAFQVALGLDFLPVEAKRALNYFAGNIRGAKKAGITHGILRGFDGNDGSDDYVVPPQPGTLMVFADGDNPELVNSQSFGRVLADDVEGDLADQVFLVSNMGDSAVTLSSVKLVNSSGGFTLGTLAPGTRIAPNESISVPVRFDPTAAGFANATLTVLHDGDGGVTEVELTGEGYRQGPAIQVLVDNNNAGGARLGAPAVLRKSFGTITNIGTADLTITSVAPESGDLTFTATGVGVVTAATPLRLAPNTGIAFDLTFVPSSTSLARGTLKFLSNDSEQPVLEVPVVGTGLPGAGSSLEYGNDFVAIESPDFPSAPVLRARSDQNGNFSFFLPPDQRYHYVIYDPVSGLVAHGLGITALSGKNTELGVPSFLPSTAPDSDGDGLPDDVEFAIGTDPNKADTDGDGIDDFATVTQGGDPLGGKSAVTGIISQRTLGGDVRDVILLPNAAGNRLLAYVTVNDAGLTIMDLTRPTQPSILGNVRLLGPNGAGQAFGGKVRVDPGAQVAAIVSRSAVGASLLHLVDVSDARNPRITQTLSKSSISGVAVADGYAYFDANYSTLYALNLRSGAIETELDFPANGLIGLVTEGEFLYVVDGSRNLTIFEIHRAQLTKRGTLAVQGTPGGVPAVANGILYVPVVSTFDPETQTSSIGGYETIDVSDPDHPVTLSESKVPSGLAEPSATLAISSSGFAILAGNAPGGGGNVADLLNAANPTNTYVFVTRFPLPEQPNAVAIAAGTAFIADGAAGLLTLNFQSSDAGGIPPVARITAVFSDSDPARPTLQLIEGSRFRVQATVTDDAQVQKVELLLNGRLVQSSVSLPLNLRGSAPNIGASATTFTVQLRATDTGGNVGFSDPTIIRLLPDVTAPSVLKIDPAEGEAKFRGFQSLRLFLSEPLAAASLTAVNFDIVQENGTILRPIGFNLQDGDTEVELRTTPLDPGKYKLVIHAAAVTDRAGNSLGLQNIVRDFSVLPYSIMWGRSNTADWFVATNWIPAHVPGPDDWVYIGPMATNEYVFVSQSESSFALADPDLNRVHLRGLESKSPLLLYYASLQVDEPYIANGPLYLLGSKLTQTVLVAGTNMVLGYNGGHPTSPFATKEGYFSVLDRVTIRGDVLIESEYHLIDSFTMQGDIYARRNRSVSFNGLLHATRDVVINGPATFHDFPVEITAGELNDVNRPGPLVTLASNVTFRGAVEIGLEGTNARLLNRGTILADDPLPFASGTYYSRIYMVGTGVGSLVQSIVNEGTIESSKGYRILVGGPFNTSLTNRGVLRASDGGLLWLSVPLTSPGIRCEAGAAVRLPERGAPWVTAPGQVSEMSGPGLWFAVETELQGGTIRMTDGAVLEGTPVFNNVTFEGEVHNYDWNSRRQQLPSYLGGYGGQIKVVTNLTLNGLIAFHRSSDLEYGGTLWFFGTQTTFNGQGRVEFAKANPFNQIRATGPFDLTGQLKIGPGITIQGNNLTIGKLNSDSGNLPLIENQGSILTQPGDLLNLSAYTFTNSGVIHIARTNVVTAAFNFVQTPAGRLEFEASRTSTGPAAGLLKIPGAATLDGNLVLAPIAPYQPLVGDKFDLLSYQSVLNQFKVVSSQPTPAGQVFTPTYGATLFGLKVEAKP